MLKMKVSYSLGQKMADMTRFLSEVRRGVSDTR
jgi:hypothetical protein